MIKAGAIGFLCIVLACCGSALGETVSIDVGATGQDVQAGWFAFTRATNATGDQSEAYSTALATSGTLTVQLRNVGGFRDRGSTYHAVADAMEGLAFSNSNVGIGLSGLKNGTYYFRSYHHDTGYTQGPIDVKLTDAVATSKTLYAGVVQSRGAATSAGPVTTVPLIIRTSPALPDPSLGFYRMGSATENAMLVGFEFTDAPPAELKVDIGKTGQTVQAGWEGFSMSNSDGADGTNVSPQEHWYFSQMGNLGSVRVRLSAPGDLGFRDRTDVTHALGDVLEDMVFNAGETSQLDLTLGSLLPGRYTLTTYHHDSSFDRGTFSLRVTDAAGAGRPAATGLDQSSGANPSAVATGVFDVYSNGIDPVVVHIDRLANQVAVLSGFQAVSRGALRVDFARDGAANDVQNGFEPWSSSTDNTTGPQTRSFVTHLANASQLSVTLTGADNTLGWRDRGDVLVPNLGDVAEDFVFDEAWIDLTLNTLGAGQYLMTSYHHDLGYVHGSVDVLVSDAAGIRRLVASNIVMPAANNVTPGVASFEIFSDGSTPITIRFQEHDAASFVMLTGFAITDMVPEPATLTLGAIGCAGLLRYARRRRSAGRARL